MSNSAWQYDDTTALPRRRWPAQTLDRPQFDERWQREYLKMLLYTSAPGRVRPYGSYVANFLNKNELKPYWSYQLDLLTSEAAATRFRTVESAQEAFPVNASNLAKKARHKFTSDEYVVQRLLSGMYSPYFEVRSTGDQEFLAAEFSTDDYETNGVYTLPRTRVELARKKGSNSLPHLFTIHVDKKKIVPAGNSQDWSLWNWAKYQLMCNYLLAAEFEIHLARGHLLVEQYQIPAMIHLSKDNPVMQVLAPHIRDAWGINNFGNPLIFGPTGVLAQCSPLSHEAVHTRLVHELGRLDWKDFEPRSPICPEHHFAVAGKIVWDAIKGHVSAWLNEKWGRADNNEQHRWVTELTNFAHTLREHSVPYVPTRTGRNWHDTREFSPSLDLNGYPKTKSVSLLNSRDIGELIQICTYVIFHATFVHDWANDRQQEDGGEILFASFGLRDRNPAQNDNWDTWWQNAKPLPQHATFQLFLAQMLTNIRWGYLLGAEENQLDESRDHEDHNELSQIRALLSHLYPVRNELAANGVLLENLRARINN